jgi:hypothetical protein
MRWMVSLLVIAGRRYTPALEAFIKVARLRNWKAGAVREAPLMPAENHAICERKRVPVHDVSAKP